MIFKDEIDFMDKLNKTIDGKISFISDLQNILKFHEITHEIIQETEINNFNVLISSPTLSEIGIHSINIGYDIINDVYAMNVRIYIGDNVYLMSIHTMFYPNTLWGSGISVNGNFSIPDMLLVFVNILSSFHLYCSSKFITVNDLPLQEDLIFNLRMLNFTPSQIIMELNKVKYGPKHASTRHSNIEVYFHYFNNYIKRW